jgi:hypothetical protein
MSQSHSIVREVAAHAAAQITQQLLEAQCDMASAELRGYVRARALGVIRAHVEQLSPTAPLSASDADEIMSGAVTRTAHLVMCNLQARPLVMPISAPHVGVKPVRTIRNTSKPAIEPERRAA